MTLLLAIMSAAALEMMLSPSLYSKIYIAQGVAWLAWYVYAASGREMPEHDALLAV